MSKKRRNSTTKQVQDKFKYQRVERISSDPLKPMNELQREYIRLIRGKDLVIATGYQGTSKTYIPTVMACDEYRVGNINNIYITRPAVSNSKSLGYFGGDLVEKMSNWLGPVLTVMRERLGEGTLELAIKREEIKFVPLEVIKGCSFNDCFVIGDEFEDITQDEAKKIVGRQGKNCTMVLSGDISQSELKERSGLRMLADMVEEYPYLDVGFIDFNRLSDIVRSEQCKRWAQAFKQWEQC